MLGVILCVDAYVVCVRRVRGCAYVVCVLCGVVYVCRRVCVGLYGCRLCGV